MVVPALVQKRSLTLRLDGKEPCLSPIGPKGRGRLSPVCGCRRAFAAPIAASRRRLRPKEGLALAQCFPPSIAAQSWRKAGRPPDELDFAQSPAPCGGPPPLVYLPLGSQWSVYALCCRGLSPAPVASEGTRASGGGHRCGTWDEAGTTAHCRRPGTK